MSQLRLNPLTGRWVTIVADRAERPTDFAPRAAQIEGVPGRPCPFCPGNEEATLPALETLDEGGAWKMRVIPNLYPAFEGDEPFAVHHLGPVHVSAEASGMLAPAPAASPSESGGADASADVATIPRAIIATGTDYSGESLPEQVTSLLSTSGMVDRAAVTAALTASPAATTMPGGGLSASPESLADCLGRLGLPPDAMPLVLDRGTVNGRDGSVIVTVGAQDGQGLPTALHVVAVGQDCTDEDVAAAQHLDIPLR